MTRTYVVVADSSRARCFVSEGKHALVSFPDLLHPEGRMHVRDLVSDQQGSTRSDGSPARHGHVPHTDVHDVEAERCAARIAGFLDKERSAGQLEELVLVMPARLLGQVRGALSKNTASKVVFALPERLIDLDAEALIARVKDAGGIRPSL